jgi:hypothetical protein
MLKRTFLLYVIWQVSMSVASLEQDSSLGAFASIRDVWLLQAVLEFTLRYKPLESFRDTINAKITMSIF